MRIVIDADVCVGNGRCYTLAPELVTDDERGYGEVIGDGSIDDDRVAEARRLVAACPEGAVSVVDD